MRFDRETRASIVREWMTMPIDQKSFCATRSIAPRTLRAWCQQARAEEVQVEQARHKVLPLHAALEVLQVRLAHLEAVVDATLASVAACRAAAEHADASEAAPCQASEAGEAELPPTPGPVEAVVPTSVAEVVAQLSSDEPRLVTSKSGADANPIPSQPPRQKRGFFFDFIEDEADVPL